MDGLVSIESKIWRELAGYPHWSRDLYIWSITSDLTNGISGIGRAAATLVLAEVQAQPPAGQPPLDAAGLDAAWKFLEQHSKIVRSGDWYWVVERIFYTCLSGDKPNTNFIRSIQNYLTAEKVPAAIRRALNARYPTLFSDPEKLMHGAAQPELKKPKARRKPQPQIVKGEV